MRRICLVAVLGLVLFSTGCSGSEELAFTDCPITDAPDSIPSEIQFQRPVPWVQESTGWFGNSALWVSLPPDGVVPSMTGADAPNLSTKFPWWRGSSGDLFFEIRRVEADDFIEGSTLDGYGPTGFIPSTLTFSGEGCWEITGQVGSETLTFVLWVCETEDFPADVSSVDRAACGAA